MRKCKTPTSVADGGDSDVPRWSPARTLRSVIGAYRDRARIEYLTARFEAATVDEARALLATSLAKRNTMLAEHLFASWTVRKLMRVDPDLVMEVAFKWLDCAAVLAERAARPAS